MVMLASETHDFAKLESLPTPSWRAENAAVSSSDPTFGRVRFTPKTLAVVVKASRELLEDSLNIGEAMPRILGEAIASEVDRVALLGSGSSNEPTGVANITGVNEVAKSASALSDFSDIITAQQLILEDNGEVGDAMIMAPRTYAELAKLEDTTGQPLQAPAPVSSLRRLVTSKIPTNGGTGTNESSIYLGDFSQLKIGVRSNPRVEILRERFSDNLQYGFLVYQRVDVQVFHAGSLAKITGITP